MINDKPIPTGKTGATAASVVFRSVYRRSKKSPRRISGEIQQFTATSFSPAAAKLPNITIPMGMVDCGKFRKTLGSESLCGPAICSKGPLKPG